MARLTDEIRAAVQDVVGKWAILRADQRRKIRDLCDLCDMFESISDARTEELDKLRWTASEITPPKHSGRYLVICEGVRTAVIRLYKNGMWHSMQRVLYWQELPRAPKKDKNERKTREGKGNDGK